MEPTVIGVLVVAALLILMFLGMGIAFTTILVAIVGITVLRNFNVAANTVGFQPFQIAAHEAYTVLPAFIILGTFAGIAGLTQDLFDTARQWVGHLRGGLAIATIATCTGFAACSGSSTATAAIMGKTVAPILRGYGYSAKLSTGLVAVGGTLAIMIPPSVPIVIYAISTDQSSGAVLMAGFIPGLLTAFNYFMYILIRARLDPKWAPALPAATWKERWLSLRKTWGMLILAGTIIGGIYFGVFTPTESGAVGAAASFFIALALRKLNFKIIKDTLVETARITAMVFAIIIGVLFFTQFLSLSGTTAALTQFMISLSVNRMIILVLILVLYFVLGMFMDSIGMMLLTLPFVYPVILKLGFSPIWFGIIVVKMCEICLITPPVGLNVFMVKGVSPDVPLWEIYKGTFPFLVMEVITLAILIAFPQIVLFLPNMMMQR